jgi:hypothetical protein
MSVTIYTVDDHDYDLGTVYGAFITREAAQAFIDSVSDKHGKHKAHRGGHLNIEELKLYGTVASQTQPNGGK